MFDEHLTIIISYALNLQNNAFSNKTQLTQLYSYIFPVVKNTNVMTWNERLNIAVDAAHGSQTNRLHYY